MTAGAVRIRPPSALRFVAIALIVPILIVALLLWVGSEYRRAEELRDAMTRTFTHSLAEERLLSLLKDAETGQRGYLLTGDRRFLDPYTPAVSAIGDEMAAVHASPERRALVAAKLAELDRTIHLLDEGDRAGALQVVRGGEGKAIMDRLRVEVARMFHVEHSAIEARRRSFEAQRARLRVTIVVLAVLLIASVLVGLAILWRSRQQRYQSLMEALEAAERNAAVLDNTADAILILDAKGLIEEGNAAATRLLGYPAEQLIGCDMAELLDLSDGIIDGPSPPPFLSDVEVRHRDGHSITVDVAISALRLPAGERRIVSLHDLSDRKRMEQAKDELISTVSHEIRTPLTSIVGSLGLLRAGSAGSLPPAAAQLIGIAENNSARLIRLINDMLDIDWIATDRLPMMRRPVDLHQVLERTCVGSEGLARSRGVEIRCTPRDRPVMVEGDADRLLQVATNLVSNAVAVAPQGSAVEIGLHRQGGRAILHVDDRGPGVPPAFRARIFGRFERGSGAGDGAGLGLAISREIVQRHGGTIGFEDRADGGTRFWVSLPDLGAERDDVDRLEHFG
ncbi:hypothetical protein GCM10011380_17590 [Sphingomonas metalli]|uniref:histidine kinase n=1 Tax=Sphingomonas metalli TaxID=1779358 RepID=A0A916WTA2_9SPHN|nr:ATP-binding protein [Sphingomonas metalli]GGB28457.1 hypothetical protein GCM10011380_17590 [Sphingomonas metalli]